MKVMLILVVLASGETKVSGEVREDICPSVASAVVAQAGAFVKSARCEWRTVEKEIALAD